MGAGIARQVVARLSPDLAVEHDFTAGLEKGPRHRLLTASNPREDLGPRDRGTERRDARLLERDGRLERAASPSQNFDDDIRIQDDAGQLRLRARRVSRRRHLTYTSASPRFSRSRHNPAMPRNVARRSPIWEIGRA